MLSNKPMDKKSGYVGSLAFFKQVIVGAFFPRPVSKQEIEKTHKDAVREHELCLKLNEQASQEIARANALIESCDQLKSSP